MKKNNAPKNIPWETVSAEDWAEGHAHVGRLMGVTRMAACTAYKKLASGLTLKVRGRPAPKSLLPTDSPAAVASAYEVSVHTARRWLASVGRPPAAPGRPPRARTCLRTGSAPPTAGKSLPENGTPRKAGA